jgi:two-component system sensor kinase FixL
LGIINSDITERRRAEEELKLRAKMLDQATDSITVSDLDGNIVYVNETVCHARGYSKEEFTGMTTFDLVNPESTRSFHERVEEILAKDNITFDTEVFHKSGALIPVEMHSRIIEVGGNKLILNVIRDITERRKAEQELTRYREHLEELVAERTGELKDAQEGLLRSERLATLGQFSGSISHELRNPLGVIDSSVYYLRTRLKDADEKVLQHLARIKSSVSNSTAIIESLLNLTRMKEPQLNNLNLADIIPDAVSTAKVPAKVKIIQNFPMQELMVKADHEQLRMTFKNIIRNAVEAMDGEGVLTIAMRATDDNQAELSFEDTGPGIAPENLENVFQPLFSTKATGIGFGLSICKMIIDKHGGTITASSEPGKGTVFIAKLPLYASENKEA